MYRGGKKDKGYGMPLERVARKGKGGETGGRPGPNEKETDLSLLS